MAKVEFKKDCMFNGVFYAVGEELEVNKENAVSIWKLNEKGFIKPLTLKQYNSMLKELDKPKKQIKLEEE